MLVYIPNIIVLSCSVIICKSLYDKTADNNDKTHDDINDMILMILNLERKVDCRFRFMK